MVFRTNFYGSNRIPLARTLALTAAMVCVSASAEVVAQQAASRSADAQREMIEYRVRRGDTCSQIARRTWNDPRRIDLIHGANDMGPPPHRLREGTILRLPRSATPLRGGAPDAEVTQVRNQVITFTPERANARRNEPLHRGDRVNTLDDSGAELTFADETQLQLGEETLIVIFGSTRGDTAPAQPGPEHTLVTGSLRARLAELSGRRPALPVRTESAQVRVEPGEAQVSIDPARTTRVAVYRGRSHVSARRRTVSVPAGFGTRVLTGSAPLPPTPLPAAPAWLTPTNNVLFALDDDTAQGTLGPVGEFTAVYEAPRNTTAPASWHPQFAADEGFHDLRIDTRVAASVTRYEARRLTPGRYWLRVSAIDGDGLEGPFNAPSALWVLRPEISRAPSSERVELRLPQELLCSVDGATLTPVNGPIVVQGLGVHRVGCAARAVSAALAQAQLRIAPGATGFERLGATASTTPSAPADAPAVVPPGDASSPDASAAQP